MSQKWGDKATTIALILIFEGDNRREVCKMLIVPFLLRYRTIDDVMQFLPDHPKCKMAEMVITERIAKR